MGMKVTKKPKLCKVVEEFIALQTELSDFGAADTEPDYRFRCIMRGLVKGEEFPSPLDPRKWELFSSVPGWHLAARKLTEKARSVYKELQKAPHKDVQALAEYYDWTE